MAKVTIEFEGAVDPSIVKDLKQVATETKKVDVAVSKAGFSFKRAGEFLVGSLGAAAVQKSIGFLTNQANNLFRTFITEGVRAANVQEQAVTALNASLASTGEFTQETSQSIQDFASALQSTTTIGDEVILQNVALAQSFTQNAEQAQALTAAAVDFAEAADLNFTEAVRRLGRATQGTTDDIAKFAPEIRNLTKEQLAAGEATRIIAERFRGAAAAQARTFGGAITQLSNTFGDLQESIGEIITQNPVLIALVQEVNRVIQDATKFFKENADALQTDLAQGVLTVIQVFQGFVEVGAFIERTLRVIIGTFDALGTQIGSVAAAAVQAANGDFKNAFNTLKSGAADAAQSMSQAFSADTIIGNLGPGLAQIEETLQAQVKNIETFQSQIVQNREDAELAAEAKRLARQQAREEQESAARAREIAALEERNNLLTQIDADKNATEIEANKAKIDQILAQEKSGSILILKNKAKQAALERQIDQQRLNAVTGFFGNLSSLRQTGDKRLFEVGKAAAIAQALVSQSVAIVKAFELGPILGPIAAAGIAVKTGVQIAQISAQKLQTGLTEVPPGFSNDSFPALLQSGERVVQGPQNEDLKTFISQESGSKDILQAILQKLDSLVPSVNVSIGQQEITEAIRDASDSGRILVT